MFEIIDNRNATAKHRTNRRGVKREKGGRGGTGFLAFCFVRSQAIENRTHERRSRLYDDDQILHDVYTVSECN